eukprot:63724-Prorocentrum_lima.AAC.1
MGRSLRGKRLKGEEMASLFDTFELLVTECGSNIPDAVDVSAYVPRSLLVWIKLSCATKQYCKDTRQHPLSH